MPPDRIRLTLVRARGVAVCSSAVLNLNALRFCVYDVVLRMVYMLRAVS